MWRFLLQLSKPIAGFLLYLGLSTNLLFAQSNIKLTGFVFDAESKLPITGATVKIDGTGYLCKSDSYGKFSFESLPDGIYTLIVSAVGYEAGNKKDIVIAEDVFSQIDIYLDRKIYYLGKITVKDSRGQISSENAEILYRADITASKARDIPELLENVPGLYIQETGAAAGESYIKIRGSDAKHVLVLVDGQKINISGSGEANLRTVPIEMVERVEVYKGGSSALYGADALGGVINIVTHKNVVAKHLSAEAEKVWGRWGTDNYNLALADIIPLDRLMARFAYTFKQSEGDFPFSYTVNSGIKPVSGVRINNDFYSQNYFLTGAYDISGDMKVSYSGQLYDSKRGIPGRADRQNENAETRDKRKLVNATIMRDTGNRNMELNLGFSRFVQHFTDTLSTIKFNSRYTNDIFTARYSQKQTWLKNTETILTSEFRRDILYHTDYQILRMSMGETERNNISLGLLNRQKIDIPPFMFADFLSLDAALRYDYSITEKDSTSYMDTVRTNETAFLSPKIGAALSRQENVGYVLRLNYGKSFRMPSINALFWKGDVRSAGNPGLRPERSEHSEAGIELHWRGPSVKVSGGMTYFHSFVRDLVVWRQSGDVWKPVNNEKAQITGHEDFINLHLFDDLIQFQYQNTVTNAINKSPGHNRYNMRLVFYPHYITGYNVRLSYRYLTLQYHIRRVDKAYVTEANTKYYDRYTVKDLMMGANFEIAHSWRISLDYKIYNLDDETYLLVSNHPMPGREWNFGVKITYGFDKSS